MDLIKKIDVAHHQTLIREHKKLVLLEPKKKKELLFIELTEIIKKILIINYLDGIMAMSVLNKYSTNGIQWRSVQSQ